LTYVQVHINIILNFGYVVLKWSVILSEGHGVIVAANIWVCGVGITGGWRKLHNAELCTLLQSVLG
jgi:hypothetical protein